MGDRAAHKRVRLADIAARAGVTPQAVSVILRNGGSSTMRIADRTAAKVRRIAEEMGYWPDLVALQLRGRECGLIGVLIGASSTTANFRRLAAIEQEAYRRDLRLLIGQFQGDRQSTARYLADFLSRGIDRLICFHNPAPSAQDDSRRLLQRFRAAVFQTASPMSSGRVVDVDRAAGVEKAVAYLVGTGRKRIALVLNDAPAADPLMHDRVVGYRRGLEHAGLATRLEWTGTGMFPPPRDLANQATEFLADQRADAVIASNDVWAIELMRSLRRAGRRVPEDIAVVGFDNTDAAALADPALTTIDQNYPGFAAAVMDLIDAEPSTARTVRTVQPSLIVRESA